MLVQLDSSSGQRRELSQTDHILCWSDKLYDRVVQLCPSPSIGGLTFDLIPVKQLRHVIREITHAALPSMASLDEGDVRVDVRPTSTTSSDHRIGHHRDLVLSIEVGRSVPSRCLSIEGCGTYISRLDTAVWRDDQGEREFGFGQERIGGRDDVDSRSLIGWIRIGVRTRREGGLTRVTQTISSQLSQVAYRARE